MNLVGLKQTGLWKAVRGVKRAVVRPDSSVPLTAADLHLEAAFVAPPAAVTCGRPTDWVVRVTNRGGRVWPSSVRLTAIWQVQHQGTTFGDPVPVSLPGPAYPGEPLDVRFTVAAPEPPGDFALAVGFDADAISTRVVAVPPADRDIDYHAVYRAADLSANHWWVVGAYHTREQYERSSRERVAMLQGFGLTPDSRVLDVGCGTGQLGDVFADYLSDRGAYYGTDIGAEAVAFCQQRFLRPNFAFRRGEMTSVPFAADRDGRFDFAVFFSVFTHTFTDESALLLSEAARLLAPGGSVVADIIASPLVERCGGNRGEMAVNRDHFLRLARMVGLAGEVVATFPWTPPAERLMLRFRNG